MPGLLRIILQWRPTLHAGIVDKNFNRTYLIFDMTDGATDGRAVYDVECCFGHVVAEFRSDLAASCTFAIGAR